MPARPGPTWGCKKPGESAASSFIPRVQTSFLPAPSAALLAHSRSEVYFAPSTAASIGSACCSLEKTWAVLGSPWIHTTRTRYLQACGKWKCTLGRSEERRVGKECRYRGGREYLRRKVTIDRR